MKEASGILYLVATPIGNLEDLSFRAVSTLLKVDAIACEDTRHSRLLLDRYGISKPLIRLHEHNEDATATRILDRIAGGESLALISDAGTPLINDPGFPLVRQARERGIAVVPVPGPCALIAAISCSGLATDRFSFEGFPPRTGASRKTMLEGLLDDPRTLIFYESSHRILAFIEAIAEVFPPDRRVVIAREITKIYETIMTTTAQEGPGIMMADVNMRKGEFVVLIEGAPATQITAELSHEQRRVLALLLEECSVKTAAALCAKISGARKDAAYQAALSLKAAQENS